MIKVIFEVPFLFKQIDLCKVYHLINSMWIVIKSEGITKASSWKIKEKVTKNILYSSWVSMKKICLLKKFWGTAFFPGEQMFNKIKQYTQSTDQSTPAPMVDPQPTPFSWSDHFVVKGLSFFQQTVQFWIFS